LHPEKLFEPSDRTLVVTGLNKTLSSYPNVGFKGFYCSEPEGNWATVQLRILATIDLFSGFPQISAFPQTPFEPLEAARSKITPKFLKQSFCYNCGELRLKACL
jgi:hypothetical protein